MLERAGIPAVSICTTAFRITAEAMARSLGFPGYQYVTRAAPGRLADEKEIDELGAVALPESSASSAPGLTIPGRPRQLRRHG